MLVIRMQRTGRKGHAQFRVVVQDSRRTPTSGRIVALLGSFNPHTKVAAVDKDKASFFLEHGAQPSDRVARLLKAEGVKLPKWVQLEGKKTRTTRHPEKLRKNQPEKPAPEPSATEESAAEPEPEATPSTDEAADVSVEANEAETPAEELTAETEAAEPAPEADGTPEEPAEV